LAACRKERLFPPTVKWIEKHGGAKNQLLRFHWSRVAQMSRLHGVVDDDQNGSRLT
jgi:hypothetical protein